MLQDKPALTEYHISRNIPLGNLTFFTNCQRKQSALPPPTHLLPCAEESSVKGEECEARPFTDGESVLHSRRVGGEAISDKPQQQVRRLSEERLDTTYEIMSRDAQKHRRWWLQDIAAKLLPGERVADCLRRRSANAGDGIGLVQTVTPSGEVGSRYDGLQMCGSVWHCPICSQRIARYRRDELQRATRLAVATGMKTYLLTLTVRHERQHSLERLLSSLTTVFNKLLKRRRWRDLAAAAGIVGYVRALEVKYGEHGWHPHLHVLIFTNGGQPLELEVIAALWAEVCKSAKVSASAAGVDLQAADAEVADYLSKPDVDSWSVSDELTSAQQKTDGDSETPWTILRRAGEGSAFHKDLWRKYAQAMKGRRQLRWSKGLRALLHLDDEIPDELIPEVEVIAGEQHVIPLTFWRLVVKVGARGTVLQLMREEGWEAVQTYLANLMASSSDGRYFGTNETDETP